MEKNKEIKTKNKKHTIFIYLVVSIFIGVVASAMLGYGVTYTEEVPDIFSMDLESSCEGYNNALNTKFCVIKGISESQSGYDITCRCNVPLYMKLFKD